MKLVPDARRGWKWLSVQAMAMNTALLTTWLALPADLKSTIPDVAVTAGAILLTVAGIVGRFIDQGGSDAKAD